MGTVAVNWIPSTTASKVAPPGRVEGATTPTVSEGVATGVAVTGTAVAYGVGVDALVFWTFIVVKS